jgi:phosphoserine phosphatase RsbU/P
MAMWQRATSELLMLTRLARPDQLPAKTNAALAELSVTATIYLVDHEQRTLRPVHDPERSAVGPIEVDTTAAGRAFMTTNPVTDVDAFWMPLLDGSERLGVLRFEGADLPSDLPKLSAPFASLLGHLVAVMSPYGDTLALVRRTRPMSVASELLWQSVPPLTYACQAFVIAAVFEPCYDTGGDGFEYAVHQDTVDLAILDTAGHGLRAGLGTTLALAAIRRARRRGDDLPALGHAVDAAFEAEFGDSRFTTAVLIRLRLDTGLVRYVNAGHPPPLVLRGATVVDRLDGGRRLPLGIGDPRADVAELALQHGDRLLCYSDGVTEARDRAGQMFGATRLAALAEQHAAADLPASETLRRMAHEVLAHLDGPPRDDATLMLLEWSSAAAKRNVP